MTIETMTLSTGITLEYTLKGRRDAPALAFVHGLGANLRQFLPQVDHFADEYRTLALSLRGHGGSSAPQPPDAAAYAPALLAEDVAALLGQLGIEQVHFVGNSLGGLVGYELLKRGSPHLLSLTTFGTTAELHSPRLTYWRGGATTQLPGINSMARLIGRTATQDRAVGAQLEAMYRQTTRPALRHIAGHIADYDYTPVLRGATLPLLLIQGSLDKEINAALGSTLATLAAAPDAQVVPLAGAGHFANLDQPEAFNAILADHLRAHSRVSA